MHERLFADNPPQKNYPENFPSKVLRHLSAWTFYSAPTKGELALLDRNMDELENETEKTSKTDPAVTKNHNSNQKTEKRTDSDQRKLESNKGRSVNADKPMKQIRASRKEFKREDKELAKMKEEKSILTSNFERKKCSKSNPSKNTRQPFSTSKSNRVKEDVNKVIKRRSSLKGGTASKQQKNTRAKSKPQTPIAKPEIITLKKTRGKILGGAETGAQISNEDLTIKGHNVQVPSSDKINKKLITGESSRHVQRAGRNHKESVKSNITEGEDCKLRHNSNYDLYTAPKSAYEHAGIGVKYCDQKNKKTVNPLATEVKRKERSVIKIPQQENEIPEDNKHTKTMTSQTMDQ